MDRNRFFVLFFVSFIAGFVLTCLFAAMLKGFYELAVFLYDEHGIAAITELKAQVIALGDNESKGQR